MKPVRKIFKWFRGHDAFEYLVVIAIVSILIAMLFPAFQRAKARAKGELPRTHITEKGHKYIHAEDCECNKHKGEKK